LGVKLKPHTIRIKLFRNQTVSLGIEKNRGRLFRRPKLTLSCSAEGKEGKIIVVISQVNVVLKTNVSEISSIH
jgi:hypothetical protein